MKLAGLILSLLGAVLLGVGLFLGFSTVHASGVPCGSAFESSSDAAEVADLQSAMEADASGIRIAPSDLSAVENACASALDSRGTVAKAASWGGVGVLVAGLVLLGVGAAQGRQRGPVRYGV